MVPGHDDFVGRLELPEIRTHSPGSNRVAAGDVLDERLRKPPPLFDFVGDDEPHPEEVGPLGRVRLTAAGHEEFGGRLHRVIRPEKVEERVEEGRLAVGPAAEKEGHHVLANVAGEAIAGEPAEVLVDREGVVGRGHVGIHGRRVAVGRRSDIGEELGPGRGRGVGDEFDRGQFGEEIGRVVRREFPGGEIERAVFDVEEPRVSVELLGLHDHARLRTSEGDRVGDGRLAVAAFDEEGEFDEIGFVAGDGLDFVPEGEGEGFGEFFDANCVVPLPPLAVPVEPLTPRRAVKERAGGGLDEAAGDRGFRAAGAVTDVEGVGGGVGGVGGGRSARGAGGVVGAVKLARLKIFGRARRFGIPSFPRKPIRRGGPVLVGDGERLRK